MESRENNSSKERAAVVSYLGTMLTQAPGTLSFGDVYNNLVEHKVTDFARRRCRWALCLLIWTKWLNVKGSIIGGAKRMEEGENAAAGRRCGGSVGDAAAYSGPQGPAHQEQTRTLRSAGGKRSINGRVVCTTAPSSPEVNTWVFRDL